MSGKEKGASGKGNGNGNGGGGETVRTYTYGNYIDEPITMTASGAGPSGTYYYHTNNLYKVRALTDENGDVIERYRYTAYGEPTILDDAGNERQRSAVGNVYMFQGRRMDEETGLYYYRNRYYSAVLGRFVTRDPVPTPNLYSAFAGNPMLYLDANGKFPFRVVSALIRGVSGGEGLRAVGHLSDHFTAKSPDKLRCCLQEARKGLKSARGSLLEIAQARIQAFKNGMVQLENEARKDIILSMMGGVGGKALSQGLMRGLGRFAKGATNSPHTMRLMRAVPRNAVTRAYGQAGKAGARFVAQNPALVGGAVFHGAMQAPSVLDYVPGGDSFWAAGKYGGWLAFGPELKRGPSRKIHGKIWGKWSSAASRHGGGFWAALGDGALGEWGVQSEIVGKLAGENLPPEVANIVYDYFGDRWLAVDAYLRQASDCYKRYH